MEGAAAAVAKDTESSKGALGELIPKERLHRTFTYAYLATGTAQLAEIGFSYFLYKTFQPSEIGIYVVAVAWIAFFNVAVDLGLEPLMVRRIGEGGVRLWRAIGAAFFVRLPVILCGALLLLLLGQAAKIEPANFAFLAVLGGQVVFNVWDGVCRSWLRANDHQTAANLITAGLSILRLALILVLGLGLGGKLLDVMLGLLLIRIAASIGYFWWARQTGPVSLVGSDSVLKLATFQVKAGAALGLISLFTVVQNRLDWLMIEHFVSVEALATYSLANKLYEISQVLVGVATTTLYPLLCRPQGATATAGHSLILRLILAFGILLGFGGLLALPEALNTIFLGKYADIEKPVRLMMIAVGFMALSGILYNLALARGMERKLLLLACFVTTTQALSNYWLIQYFGIVGATIGMLFLAVGMSLGLTVIVARQSLMDIRTLCRVWLLMLGFAALSAWATWYANINIWVASICCLAIAVTCWYMLFSQSERSELIATAKRFRSSRMAVEQIR